VNYVIKKFDETYSFKEADAYELIEQLEEPNDIIKKVSEESEDESEDENELAAYRKNKLIQSKEHSQQYKESSNEEVNIKVDNNV